MQRVTVTQLVFLPQYLMLEDQTVEATLPAVYRNDSLSQLSSYKNYTCNLLVPYAPFHYPSDSNLLKINSIGIRIRN